MMMSMMNQGGFSPMGQQGQGMAPGGVQGGGSPGGFGSPVSMSGPGAQAPEDFEPVEQNQGGGNAGDQNLGELCGFA